MKDPQHFTLLDGTFTVPEASRVLLSLINSKLDYHSMEKLSNEERFGRDLAQSEIRLRELSDLKSSVKDIIASADRNQQKLKIEGQLKITLV